MFYFSGDVQKYLINDGIVSPDTVLVVDLRELYKNPSSDVETESGAIIQRGGSTAQKGKNRKKDRKPSAGANISPTAIIEKNILRVLERLMVQNATLVGWGDCCQVLIQLALGPLAQQPKFRGAVKGIKLFHPALPVKFVNQYLASGRSGQSALDLHACFPDELSRDKRLQMIQYVFPKVSHDVSSKVKFSAVLSLPQSSEEQVSAESQANLGYDSSIIDSQGMSLFLSSITCEMSPLTKQYERKGTDITGELLKEPEPDVLPENSTADPTTIDWAKCPVEIGGLILRGNRCVLVRSLQKEWSGMRLPSVAATTAETKPEETAIRSIVERCGVDADEVSTLPCLAPVHLYDVSRQVRVVFYPLYATQPPPEGPLEDADMEDDETPYDWYTLPNAWKHPSIDQQSKSTLITLATSLQQAAQVGLIPQKWGGVFGQELYDGSFAPWNSRATVPTPLAAGSAPVPSARDTSPPRELTALANPQIPTSPGSERKKLPVTIISGFLGAGKTTLMSHILTNYVGLKVAILVNDMGEINIDAALVQQTAVTIHQREEHLVELSNGCICCTLREDLLVEIRKIAEQNAFDYLLIESSGISEPMPVAETFTFEDDKGKRLDDIATIDAMVTVVDGSTFSSELNTVESLRQRNWQADAEDQRSIAHLLCDQIEFSNIVILNKCDRMEPKELSQVKRLLHEMNPTARFLESTFSAVPLEKILGTNLFSMTEAEKHEGWLQEARIGEHTPETLEYGISSFTYRALKPFHPARLMDTLDTLTDETADASNGGTILRAKGFLWLVDSPELQGEFSFAGNQYTVLAGNPWWAAIDRCEWPEGLAENIAPLWHEPHGDRQQEMVIIGQELDKEKISASLAACLCDEDEMDLLVSDWKVSASMDSPFYPLWKAAGDMRLIKGGSGACQDDGCDGTSDHGHSHDHGHGHSHDHGHSHRHAPTRVG